MSNRSKHGGILLYTAMSLKKGEFNTPTMFYFLKKENGGFDCYFKVNGTTHAYPPKIKLPI